VRTQLLCTFTNENTFEDVVNAIHSKFELFSKKIFILKLDPSKELVVSYNIMPTTMNKFLPNTIMVHRKKETNTMYTINALNKLILDLNNGVSDSHYQVNWDEYRNAVILTDGDGYKILKTTLFRIIDVN
jgi:hypothetical protein